MGKKQPLKSQKCTFHHFTPPLYEIFHKKKRIYLKTTQTRNARDKNAYPVFTNPLPLHRPSDWHPYGHACTARTTPYSHHRSQSHHHPIPLLGVVFRHQCCARAEQPSTVEGRKKSDTIIKKIFLLLLLQDQLDFIPIVATKKGRGDLDVTRIY